MLTLAATRTTNLSIQLPKLARDEPHVVEACAQRIAAVRAGLEFDSISPSFESPANIPDIA
jgi:hypothetical protein